jgi:hypothetical protein
MIIEARGMRKSFGDLDRLTYTAPKDLEATLSRTTNL